MPRIYPQMHTHCQPRLGAVKAGIALVIRSSGNRSRRIFRHLRHILTSPNFTERQRGIVAMQLYAKADVRNNEEPLIIDNDIAIPCIVLYNSCISFDYEILTTKSRSPDERILFALCC